jgi:hypothetical protein
MLSYMARRSEMEDGRCLVAVFVAGDVNFKGQIAPEARAQGA